MIIYVPSKKKRRPRIGELFVRNDNACPLLALFNGGFLTLSPNDMSVSLTTAQWRELLEVQDG